MAPRARPLSPSHQYLGQPTQFQGPLVHPGAFTDPYKQAQISDRRFCNDMSRSGRFSNEVQHVVIRRYKTKDPDGLATNLPASLGYGIAHRNYNGYVYRDTSFRNHRGERRFG